MVKNGKSEGILFSQRDIDILLIYKEASLYFFIQNGHILFKMVKNEKNGGYFKCLSIQNWKCPHMMKCKKKWNAADQIGYIISCSAHHKSQSFYVFMQGVIQKLMNISKLQTKIYQPPAPLVGTFLY